MRYTRDGHFTLDANGQIVTSDGYALQGDSGAITITPTTRMSRSARMAPFPASSMASATRSASCRFRISPTTAPSPNRATISIPPRKTPTAAADSTISQGALESSNVQPVLEISHMIEVMRAYQATASLSQSQEDLTRQAIDKLGAMPN